MQEEQEIPKGCDICIPFRKKECKLDPATGGRWEHTEKNGVTTAMLNSEPITACTDYIANKKAYELVTSTRIKPKA